MKGPGIFLAQFMGDEPPFNSFDSICHWAAELGYVGVQLPSWDGRCMDLAKAAESKASTSAGASAAISPPGGATSTTISPFGGPLAA